MNASTLSFLGIQLLSVALAVVILFEHRRLCARRRQMFERLGDTGTARRRRTQYILTALYILMTLLIVIVSGSAFFL